MQEREEENEMIQDTQLTPRSDVALHGGVRVQ